MTIALLTESQPAQACMDALGSGELVPNPQTGLALAASNGEVMLVMWPYGYSSRLVDGELELLDDRGQFIAREGETVQMGGGSGAGGLFYACAGSVERVGP